MKKENVMIKDMIEGTIGILKTRVNSNLDIIKKNQKKIKNILQEPVSGDRTKKLEQESAINKKLLSENHDFINMQLTLINFMEKYRDTLNQLDVGVELFNDDDIDYFEMTIEGRIPFSKNHPKFDDNDFFEKLIAYYTEHEDYETCARLMQQKGISKSS